MAAMSTYYLIQRHLLRHAKPKSPVCLLLRSSSVSVLTRKSNHPRRFPSFFFSSISSSLPLKCPYVSLPSLLVPKYLSTSVVESKQDEDKQDKDNMSLASHSKKNDEESYSKEEEEEEDGSDCTIVSMRENGRSCDISEEMMTESSALKLSVKEKKKLASYAHSLGDKLKCQLVGKSGVTDSVVFSFLETLEKNELLKVKIHRTCPGEVEDMILRLEEATGSVAVGKIARTVILYRPSPTKLIEKRR